MNEGKSQILVNRVARRSIVSKRGLRQGDSLSPLLFVLAVESFTRMLSLAAQNNRLIGLSTNNYMGTLFSLQYADDTLLFVNTSMENTRYLKFLLYGFVLASGLKINFSKVWFIY